ncbi:FkbM family methyltransferase [Asticcacaulis sp. W401b]|uniref:FkbM family methyltransferase n=1 Tax=Asticcacaulis sp. W401b TaxID=3388666 RepID=UPI003970D973
MEKENYALAYFNTLYTTKHTILGVKQDIKNRHSMYMSAMESDFLIYCANNISNSNSQLFQDLFVLFVLKEKKNGVFVEFGAVDGIYLSNSLLLEKEYGWTGVLCEPVQRYHTDLTQNRTCSIDTRCVWSRSGEKLTFIDTDVDGLGTLEQFRNSDPHGPVRASAQSYEVETVSLQDLLETHAIPTDFDFLSIDTEGSELDILKSTNFEMVRPKVIVCEHNFVEDKRMEIRTLLTDNGYENVFQGVTLFEDWFVRVDVISAQNLSKCRESSII